MFQPLFQYQPGNIRTAVLFPNQTEAALGSLGFQTAFHLLNMQHGFQADMIWMEKEAKTAGFKPYEIIALSIAYELDIFNFIAFLIDNNLEPIAWKRKGPLIICGGVLPLINPRPMAHFCDIILIGDGEFLIPRFAEIYRRHHTQGKKTLLEQSAKEAGFFVPGYNSLEVVRPLIKKRESILHSVVMSEQGHFGNMFLIEVGRGCPRKCRFCASAHMHPYEYHPVDSIVKVIENFAPPKCTVGLIGSALSDYPELESLIENIVNRNFKLGISSLRPDAITPKLAKLLKTGGINSLTIAPEAGSLEMRKKLGKGISNRIIVRSAKFARQAGMKRIKLYFMIGLPGETTEDIDAISELVNAIAEHFPLKNIELSINAFIPKPGTPLEEATYAGEKYTRKVRSLLRKSLKGAKFSRKSPSLETAQAILSKGNISIGKAALKSIVDGIAFKSAVKLMNETGE